MSESPHTEPPHTEPPHTEPPRTGSSAPPLRRLLAPLLAVVAVLAVAAGVVVLTRGGKSPAGAAPPVIALADGGSSMAVAAMPAGLGPVKITGTLPTTPGSAAAYNLPAGTAPADVVSALAAALHLSGQPKHVAHGWVLTAGALTLRVGDEPGLPWRLVPTDEVQVCDAKVPAAAPDCPVGAPVNGGPGVVLPPRPVPGGRKHPGAGPINEGGPINGGGPNAGSTTTGSTTTGSTTTGSTTTGSTTTGSDTTSGSRSGGGSSGNAGSGTASSSGSGTGTPATVLPVPGKTVPAPTRPTDDDALAAARPVFSAIGLGEVRTQVDRNSPKVMVIGDPVLDGLPTSGYSTVLIMEPDGTIDDGGGWLAHPAAGARYPLVPAADALKQLVFPDVARLCGTKVCPVRPIEITGAELGLVLRYQVSDLPVLLPAWRYQVRDRDNAPLVLLAIQPAYLGDRTGRPNVPGGVPPAVDPSGAYQNGPGGGPAKPPVGGAGRPRIPVGTATPSPTG